MRAGRLVPLVLQITLLALSTAPAVGGRGACLAASRPKVQLTRADSTRTAASVESLVVRTTLSNGLQLRLLPREGGEARIHFALELRFGNESSLRGRATAAEMAGGALELGTTTRRRQDILDELKRLDSGLWIDGNVSSAFGGGSTTRESLPAVLALMAEILREPSFPDSQFAMLRRDKIMKLRRETIDPVRVCWYPLDRNLESWPPEDPRYQPTVEEHVDRLQKCTKEDAIAFYRKFYGASHGVISVVGDFDPKVVADQLGRLFGDWASPEPWDRLALAYRPVTPIHERFEVPGAPRAIFHAATLLTLRDDDPDYPALVLGTYLLGGSARGQDAGGFGRGFTAWFYADDVQEFGRWGARAACLPRQIDSVRTEFDDTLARALRDGFTAQQVKTGQARWEVRRCLGRSENRDIVGTLNRLTLVGRTFAWDQALEQKILRLTPSEILAAMQRHLAPAKFCTAMAGDFAGVGPANPSAPANPANPAVPVAPPGEDAPLPGAPRGN